ncbi:MAG: hypothetical protein GX927_06820 [Lentisphaerae bacterium]|nr:hypothetical protein [Lentisphaerota bacterium]
MLFPRKYYLQQLIEHRENGLVKVVCGLRHYNELVSRADAHNLFFVHGKHGKRGKFVGLSL